MGTTEHRAACRVPGPHLQIRVREIAGHDLDEVAALLGRGFERPSGYYAYAPAQLMRHPTPAGCPKFVYCGPVLRHPAEPMLPAVDLGGRVWLGGRCS
jgi:hypothetical protein